MSTEPQAFQALSEAQIKHIAKLSHEMDLKFTRRKTDAEVKSNARLMAIAIVFDMNGSPGRDMFAEEWMRLAEVADNSGECDEY